MKNPVVVLANYFFDSIPQDCFYIKDGQLYESLVTLSTPQAEPELDDPALLDRVQISYKIIQSRLHTTRMKTSINCCGTISSS
ncbi:MAG: hypothetical protein GDA43_09875 [Hormoscilla sp. SP5CHS1]|nr:hypothetical protein [Hormoscilla sp. SP12CHS1]MBC6453481.1 hypothetical protein [Hormoscilla sp. SP5CHS1]